MSTATLTPDRQRFRQVLAEMAEKAKAKLPESTGRVEKAVALVLQGDIAYDAATSTALVNSCSDATKVYKVRGKVCECPDFERAPQHLCKHVLGVMFLIRLQQVLDAEAPPAQPLETPRGPLGEAPASVNLKVLLHGHEVMVTLRDADEGHLLTRLQALLTSGTVQPLPARAQPTPQARQGSSQPRREAGPVQEVGWCAVHGVEMTLNTKDGRSWWSHLTPEGWCKGRTAGR
jgi:hypothetical protein